MVYGKHSSIQLHTSSPKQQRHNHTTTTPTQQHQQHHTPTQHQKVIELNVSTVSADPNKTVDITDLEAAEVRFSYSTRWAPTTVAFDDRMDRYARYSFLPQHLEVSGCVWGGVFECGGGV